MTQPMVHDFCCRQVIPTYQATEIRRFITKITHQYPSSLQLLTSSSSEKPPTSPNNSSTTTTVEQQKLFQKHHQVTLIKVFQVTSSGQTSTVSCMSSSNWTAEAHDPPRSHALCQKKPRKNPSKLQLITDNKKTWLIWIFQFGCFSWMIRGCRKTPSFRIKQHPLEDAGCNLHVWTFWLKFGKTSYSWQLLIKTNERIG